MGMSWRCDTEARKKQWQYGSWGEGLLQRSMDDAKAVKKDFPVRYAGI